MESTEKKAAPLAYALGLAQFKPLFFIFVLGTLLNLQLDDMINSAPKDEDSYRMMLQLGMGIWELFEGVMIFLILSWGIPKVHPTHAAVIEARPFNTPYLGSFLAEYLRQLAQTLLFGLLLLVPGVVRYCRLIFVPYIAIFAKQYRADESDAIQFSLTLTKPYFWRIVGVFFATTAVQVGLEFLPQLVVELHVWAVRIVLMALSLGVGIWTYAYMFLLFERSLTERPTT